MKIDKQTDCMDTKRFLQWLSFSTRPMTLEEIAEVVVVDFELVDEPQYTSEHRYWDNEEILEKCSGFITHSKGLIKCDTMAMYLLKFKTGMVKLAHFSVKEYLVSKYLCTGAASRFHLTEELSHSWIAQTCLVYLLQLDTVSSLNEDVLKSFPLMTYAAANWIFHAQSGGIDKSGHSSMLSLTCKLLMSGSASFANWVRIWDVDEDYMHRDLARRCTDIPAPLYYTSLTGLQQVSQHLLEMKADVNAQGGKYHNPLQAASFGGYEVIVKLLLEKGADVNAEGGHFGNALQAASFGGYEVIVKLLLEKASGKY